MKAATPEIARLYQKLWQLRIRNPKLKQMIAVEKRIKTLGFDPCAKIKKVLHMVPELRHKIEHSQILSQTFRVSFFCKWYRWSAYRKKKYNQ